jgi:isocitrate dehydrogenase kinase/phosphatase
MVMLVFALPGHDTVFKVIRDNFDFPKQGSRRHVLASYRLVFKHDRVGRLVDAQEFEQLRFKRALFDVELLDELLTDASNSVSVQGDEVVLAHVYTERKVTPLNLYLRRESDERGDAAVIDYGNAIKDLAAANIFPGDFLLKNFGVTRHGRVVFYDYDELCLLTDCNFRVLPRARSDEEELAAEPWFTVGPHDIFPEEFRKFLGLSERLLETFLRHHEALLSAGFWRDLQQRIEDGEMMDFYPYSVDRCLDNRRADPEQGSRRRKER